MDFKVGDKVVYPNHGVGVIEQVTKKSVGDIVASFYCLRIISTDSTVMVPVVWPAGIVSVPESAW